MTVTVRAPAKINLYLGVGRPRPDGFHPLMTVYQAVALYDDVTVGDAHDWSVSVTGARHVDVSAVPTGPDNIAVRAGQALVAHHGLDRAASIDIHKGIPVAGGMAGGSADAAATLVALDRLWSLETPDDDLLALAADLGSDVPFALLGGTALGRGRGELVEPVADTGTHWWVVVLGDEGLSTPSVYAALDILEEWREDLVVPTALLESLGRGESGRLGVHLTNDLQEAAIDLRPGLADVFADVGAAGCEMPLLSGSGPTALGCALDAQHARDMAATLLDKGYRVLVTHGPVAGAHVVTYG